MNTELSVYNEFQVQLAAFKSEDADLVFDVETPDGELACREYHKKLRKVYNGIDKLRLATTKTLRDEVKAANDEGNAILAEIDAMANPRKKLLDDKEARLQAIIDAKAAEAEAKAAKIEADRLADLEAREAKIKAAEDKLKDEAEAAQKLLDDAEAAKQIEAGKLAAVEAAKRKPDIDAINAAILAKKKQDDAVAEVKRKAKKEAERVKADQFEKDRKEHAEKNRIAAEKLKRELDEDHREEIERLIVDNIQALIKLHPDMAPVELAQEIVDAITTKKILNIKIIY